MKHILLLLLAGLLAGCATPTTQPPTRYAWITGLKPEKAAYYRDLHAHPWPSVNQMLKTIHIQNFSIYEREIDGKPVDGVGRDRGMVFQAYTSFAWLTVRQNVEYGLKLQGIDAAERRRKAEKVLEQVGLHDFADRYPKDLSGGMKQRVAIARTLVNQPRVVLMDEPFGALDPQTRWGMQGLLLDVSKSEDNTILFVTHDVSEAVYLADTVYVLSARPARILHRVEVPAFEERSIALKSSSEFRAVEKKLLDLLYASPPSAGAKG